MTIVTSPLLITHCPGALICWLEDDRELCRHVAPWLQDCGWRLAICHHLAQFQTVLQQNEPDLILLEIRVPGEDTLSSVRNWRRQGLTCPMLILSALADSGHRVDGLAAGANGYLAKPFYLSELTRRIEHLLASSLPRRLSQHAMDQPIPLGPLTLEPARSALLSPQGDEWRLTRGDLALLLALLRPPTAVHPRSGLLRAIGSLVNPATSRTLDVRLSRLRRRLRTASAGAVGIASVRGRGYALTVSAAKGADPPHTPVPGLRGSDDLVEPGGADAFACLSGRPVVTGSVPGAGLGALVNTQDGQVDLGPSAAGRPEARLRQCSARV